MKSRLIAVAAALAAIPALAADPLYEEVQLRVREVQDGQVVTSGGRILAPTAVAPTVEQACELALAALKQVTFEGMDYRTDIARGGSKLCPSK